MFTVSFQKMAEHLSTHSPPSPSKSQQHKENKPVKVNKKASRERRFPIWTQSQTVTLLMTISNGGNKSLEQTQEHIQEGGGDISYQPQ